MNRSYEISDTVAKWILEQSVIRYLNKLQYVARVSVRRSMYVSDFYPRCILIFRKVYVCNKRAASQCGRNFNMFSIIHVIS